jgi:ectoine hydroxylase-related dioxygenase (phytanoyl-CoA dioxygenase family)
LNLAERYSEDGYLVVHGLVSRSELEELKADTVAIFRGRYPVEGIVKADDSEPDDAVLAKYLCIHQPHKISEIQRSFIHHSKVVDVLKEIIGPDVKCMQSMLFVKPAGFPGQAWHQDERYIPTEDRSLTGAWIAIDDATVENGCLWVIPGSHKWELCATAPQAANDEYDGIGETAIGLDEASAIPAEAPSGSVVFFNGYLLHQSKRNRSNGFRRALVNHYMSARSRLRWCGREDYRDIEMVCGVDPWAERGLEQISSPWLRPRS